MRADDLVVDETCVRIFVWDISDGATNPVLMFAAERIFEEQIKDEREWKKKATRHATHPRTLEPSATHTRVWEYLLE